MVVYSFEAFPESSLSDTFRVNVKNFIDKYGDDLYECEDYHVWRTWLIIKDSTVSVFLYTFEETVNQSTPVPNCLTCRCAGWGTNLVSKRRYHFIVPVDKDEKKVSEDGFLGLKSHTLHCLIHCNGFGHILCINSLTDGSISITGGDLISLLDRIFTCLRSRKISVLDNSRKQNMDLRMVYGLSYGQTWFGRWDYKFSHGSYGVSKDDYEEAIQFLRTQKLDKVVQDSQSSSVADIISRYQDLTEKKLETVGDIFKFMLSLRYDTSQVKYVKHLSPSIIDENCKNWTEEAAGLQISKGWPLSRLEHTANVVVEILLKDKFQNGNGLTRNDLRNAVIPEIGNTGLIDCVLSNIDQVSIGGFVVTRVKNPKTRIFEFSIQVEKPVKMVKPPIEPLFENEVYKDLSGPSSVTGESEDEVVVFYPVFGRKVYEHIAILYEHIFKKSKVDEVEVALKIVADSKHLIKEWSFPSVPGCWDWRLICHVIPVETETFENTVGEQVLVPLKGTIHDMKVAIETTMRDTYCIMENLKVTEIVEMEGVDDGDYILGKMQIDNEFSVRGSGIELNSDLIYEGGKEKSEIDCTCGATEDDGELMVQCNECDVWVHCMCFGLDPENMPEEFICDICVSKGSGGN